MAPVHYCENYHVGHHFHYVLGMGNNERLFLVDRLILLILHHHQYLLGLGIQVVLVNLVVLVVLVLCLCLDFLALLLVLAHLVLHVVLFDQFVFQCQFLCFLECQLCRLLLKKKFNQIK